MEVDLGQTPAAVAIDGACFIYRRSSGSVFLWQLSSYVIIMIINKMLRLTVPVLIVINNITDNSPFSKDEKLFHPK